MGTEIHPLAAFSLIFVAGVSVSFINIMAGGGSVISLAVLMFLGVDATVANGSNRIGILTGTLSGAVAYHREKTASIWTSAQFGFWAVPGALLGAWWAVRIDNQLFERILGMVLIFVIATLFIPKPAAAVQPQLEGWRRYLMHPLLFLIGFYGGFVQAGVGFLIMAALRHLANMKLLNINVFKNHIVLLYTIPILLIFGFSGKIRWDYALVLGAGNAVGAWLSVKLSVRKGDRVIKTALAAAIGMLALKMLF